MKNSQTDLVLFMDGYEKENKVTEKGPDDFRHTWKRPKWHILIQGLRTLL